MTGLYAERLLPPETMERYYDKHYQQPVTGFPRAFAARAAAADPVSVHRFTKQEQQATTFAACWRRSTPPDPLRRSARCNAAYRADQHLPGRAGPRIRLPSQDVLRGLLRYLSIGLRPLVPASEAAASTEIVEEWLGIVEIDGTLISAPPDWSRLVRLLAIEDVTPRGARDEQRTISEFLRRICGRLNGGDGADVGLLDLQQQSPWGRFRIRAYRMPDMGGRRADRIGLIGRTEPRTLALVRGTGASDLSPQRREVALLVADGRSNQEIARTLSLKLNTASYHVKQVFTRLKVHNRKEVERALLNLARDGTVTRVHSVELREIETRV